MDNARLRIIFDKNKKANNTTVQGLIQIEIRVAGSNKSIVVSTGMKLYKDQFLLKVNSVCKSSTPNNLLIDGVVFKKLREIESYVYSDRCKSLVDVKNWLIGNNESNEKVIPFIESELIKRSKSNDLKFNTIKQHYTLINKLKSFGKIDTFKDITYNNISDFDNSMRNDGLLAVSANKKHSIFKVYIKEAINKGLISKNPYDLFKPQKSKSKDPIYLTEEEVNKLKEYTPDYGYLERTKDLYLFQCYTGLAYADLMKFSKESIKEIDGYRAIQSNREKTDENFITLFLPEAERIAIKYNYELPKITNQKYNEYLKDVAKGAGINKPLISHSARHTFATYLLNKDIPIETVARALGHSNIKQTQHYAKLLGKKVIDDMKKLL